MIRVCASYGITATRVAGFSGAWVPPTAAGQRDEKIGAIGVRISRWITSHGFAFNVATDINFFSLIVPCGIADRGVTSLAAKLGRVPEMAEVEDRFVDAFADVFGRQPAEALPSHH
jgi:lipoyl(octanoyl) transferase